MLLPQPWRRLLCCTTTITPTTTKFSIWPWSEVGSAQDWGFNVGMRVNFDLGHPDFGKSNQIFRCKWSCAFLWPGFVLSAGIQVWSFVSFPFFIVILSYFLTLFSLFECFQLQLLWVSAELDKLQNYDAFWVR